MSPTPPAGKVQLNVRVSRQVHRRVHEWATREGTNPGTVVEQLIRHVDQYLREHPGAPFIDAVRRIGDPRP